MQRPPFTSAIANGLLRTSHFQMAYATTDIEQAQALFRDRYGIANWTRLEGQLPAGGHIHVELAWMGTIMYELMTATGAGSHIYMHQLPAGDGFRMKHHHLGYLVEDEAGWDGLMASIQRDDHIMPHLSHNDGFMKSCFVDAPELGHYLEYIWPEAAGLEFFQSVAGN